jgi:mRNA interferase HigB
VHVITIKRLREFWGEHPQAEKPLRAWHQIAEQAEWDSFESVRHTFGARVDRVGKCLGFDIGGNKFRLVVVAHFDRGKLYIRRIMTHAEYSKNRWKDECLGNT